MSVEIVHPVDRADLPDMYRSALKAYLRDPDDVRHIHPWRDRAVDPALCWTAREHGRTVGTLRTIEGAMSVPGGEVDADLLSLVSVSPTHRRRGLLRRMLDSSLTEAHGRGVAVSILVAAEWPIYGRFGYAPAVWVANQRIDLRRRGAAVVGADLPSAVGAMREIEAVEASDLAPALYVAESRRRGGLVARDEHWWDRELRRTGVERAVVRGPGEPAVRHAVHADAAGTVDGYVRWAVVSDEGDDGLGGTVAVQDLFAASLPAYRELWRFLLGLDLVSRIDAPHRPVDDPLPHLLVDGRTVTATVGDAMWLRLLDVPAALSARTYPAADTLTVEVVDPAVGGWAQGRFTLTTDASGAASCERSTRTADLTVPQATLASVYLGGVRASVLAHTVDEHTPGAADRFDRLFATSRAPWRATDF